eukprot:TRINITY_DN1096_c0_g6_i1.p1 TRINITY_DN1096_c0_g6~~TRINITY_DN1096_c0_g6_i1.p1  ORF type:complete len:717 (-),score=65.14 TRINITY_DN1096_c0_g6_i1:698-2848(-)
MLKNLVEFNISGHEMRGSIPRELSTWKKIKNIDLYPDPSYFSITGTLPVEFSEWSALEKFRMYQNEELGGTLPVQYSVWRNISYISLCDNFLQGTLPVQYSTWSNISHVYFCYNELNGTLPVEYSAWGTVSKVSFVGNNLKGSVPMQYSVWSNFTLLLMRNSDLCISDYLAGLFLQEDHTHSYQLPKSSNEYYEQTSDYYDYFEDVGDDSKETDVKSMQTCLSSNQQAHALLLFKKFLDDESLLNSWQGDDPCNQWRGITCTGDSVTTIEYTIGYTFEDPIIPREFSSLKSLKKILFDGASISGTIPPELSHLTDLEVFQIKKQHMTGKIPKQLSTWAKLRIFDVQSGSDYQSIYGVLPVELSEWRELNVFNIDDNNINGTLPIQFSTWVNISYVSLEDNKLVGTLPVQYSAWVDAKYLNFRENDISGRVPSQVSFWSNANFLYLHPQKSNNLCISDYFAGQLSSKGNKLNTDVDNLPICNVLSDTYASTEANALIQFGNSVQDQSLFSSWTGDNPCNQWRGIICTENNVTAVEYTYLKDASTMIPPEFSNLQQLKNIIFNKDGITGTIPPELSILDIVQFEIYEQNMQGTLPVELSTWQNIEVFNLKGMTDGGQLTGFLPAQFSAWTNLKYFDVGKNALSGTVPPQLSSWYNISYVDISGNQFTGSVPEEYSIWKFQCDFYLADQKERKFCVTIKLADFFYGETVTNDIYEVPIC